MTVKKGVVEGVPIDISDLLIDKPRNRVMRIGIEIEGGWRGTPNGLRIDRDGSVFKDAGDNNRDCTRSKYPDFLFGEIQSKPIQPIGISSFIQSAWPHKVDLSCGLHIHMSFKTVYEYAVLMNPNYQETLLKYLGEWAKEEGLAKDHPIWPRLSGKSEYCQKKFWPDAQVNYRGKDFDKHREGHRYTIINYCWRDGKVRTIECRVLPMLENADLATRGLLRIVDITNACLVKLVDKKKDIQSGKISIGEDETYEISIVEEV